MMRKSWTIEKQRASNLKYYYKNKKRILKKAKERHQKLRLEVLSRYSNGKLCCNCCGESIIAFLCIDHINGGGAKHRKKVGNSYRFYYWLKRNNYPKGYQVLCHNCNMATTWGRACPHELLEGKDEG
jgi:hypothetical protein